MLKDPLGGSLSREDRRYLLRNSDPVTYAGYDEIYVDIDIPLPSGDKVMTTFRLGNALYRYLEPEVLFVNGGSDVLVGARYNVSIPSYEAGTVQSPIILGSREPNCFADWERRIERNEVGSVLYDLGVTSPGDPSKDYGATFRSFTDPVMGADNLKAYKTSDNFVPGVPPMQPIVTLLIAFDKFKDALRDFRENSVICRVLSNLTQDSVDMGPSVAEVDDEVRGVLQRKIKKTTMPTDVLPFVFCQYGEGAGDGVDLVTYYARKMHNPQLRKDGEILLDDSMDLKNHMKHINARIPQMVKSGLRPGSAFMYKVKNLNKGITSVRTTLSK